MCLRPQFIRALPKDKMRKNISKRMLQQILETGCGQYVPCSKCPECKQRRASQWAFRLLQEYKACWSGTFITLTYKDSEIPWTDLGYQTIVKRDIQLFMKTLRNAHRYNEKLWTEPDPDGVVEEIGIKYYCVGEYGGKTKRPHYHMLLFNADLEKIDACWTKGNIHYLPITEGTVGYTFKYMTKQSWRPLHKNDDREPLFALMSKGLGKSYLSDEMVSWHLDDVENRNYAALGDGKKIALPRYYKDRMYNEGHKIIISDVFKQRLQVEKEKLVYKLGEQKYLWNKRQNIDAAYTRQEWKELSELSKL